MDSSGDMVMGAGSATFLVNSPQAVVQCVQTALKLWQGEWYLDTTAGMPWRTQVLGFNTGGFYDTAIRNCILGVTGVTGIAAYSSTLNTASRLLTVTATIDTQYGQATFSTSIGFALPPASGFGVGGFGVTVIPGS